MEDISRTLAGLFLHDTYIGISHSLSEKGMFANALIGNFLVSLGGNVIQEGDFQVILGENPISGTLWGLPQCPIWFEMEN